MKKYKLSVISYLNTLPFLYGLENDEKIKQLTEILIDYPSETARKLLNFQVDIGLVPVVVLSQNPHLQIISDYCIAADGAVDSVFLLSQKPLEQIKTIVLDYQSRTSIALVKVLAKYFWKINPIWLPAYQGFEHNPNIQAAVIIGDRALQLKQRFKYHFDLAAEWKKFTGLPFVFALWTANKNVSETFVRILNKALALGLNQIDRVVEFYKNQISKLLSLDQAKHYLKQRIKYHLDNKKRQAINLFLSYIRQLDLNVELQQQTNSPALTK